MPNGQETREPWFSSILSQWVAKIGVPAAIVFVLLFLQGKKLDEISSKLDNVILVLRTGGQK